MAKGPKAVSVNTALLAGIGAGAVTHISKADGDPLLNYNPPLVEVNTNMLDDKGQAAVRLTEAGKQMVNGADKKPEVASVGTKYGIITDAALPASRRGIGLGGGAPTQYPFDNLEIGQTFFVPVSAKHPNPVKTLGSTVSSANMRYAVETGETKEVERSKRGPKNRSVLDADGKKIMEKVTVKVHKLTRKFTIRPVEKGKTYGNWVAPDNGALIGRVELTNKE